MKYIITYTSYMYRDFSMFLWHISTFYLINIISAKLRCSGSLYIGLVELTCHRHIVKTDNSLLFICTDKCTYIYIYIYIYIGRFKTYSGITKIYYRKTAGHVFTKPVHKEGTTQNFFPSKLFFIVVHNSAARRCEFMWWENGRNGGEVVLCFGISHE